MNSENLVDLVAKRTFKSKVKATFTLGIIVLAYILSWSPITIIFTADIAKIFPNETTYYRAYAAGELTGFVIQQLMFPFHKMRL